MIAVRLGAVGTLVCSVLLGACADRAADERPLQTLHRFGEATAPEPFDEESLSTASPASDVNGSTAAPHWTARATGIETLTRGAERTFALQALPAALSRPGEFDPAGLDLVELDVEGLGFPGAVRLSWRSRGSGAAEPISLLWRVPRPTSGEPQRVRFDLRSSAGWRGGVRNLELQISGPVVGSVRLSEPRLLRRALRADQLGALSGRLLGVELQNELRPARLLSCGASSMLELDDDRPLDLALGIGTSSFTSSSSVLSVSTRRGQVEEWRPTAGDALASDAWHDLRLRLDPAIDGRHVEITHRCPEQASPETSILFLASPLGRSERPASAPLILLVSIDTLRADRMSLYGNRTATTPGIDRWAAESALVFDHAMASAGATLPSHASILTGLPVLRHGAFDGGPLAPEMETIAETLASRGYLTLAVTGGAFLHPRYGLAQGFDRYCFWQRGEGDNALELPFGVAKVREWLDRFRDWPLFVFLHTYETHGPYYPRHAESDARATLTTRDGPRIWPEGRSDRREVADDDTTSPGSGDPFLAARRRVPWIQVAGQGRALRDDERALAGELYDQGVSRADELLAPLLSALSRSRDPQRPVSVVLLSDHGEALGDEGLWGHGYLYEHNLHVPLAIATSDATGATRGRRVERLVSLESIRATLIELARAGRPSDSLESSLLRSLESPSPAEPGDEPFMAYAPETAQGLALRRGPLKLIFRDAPFGPRARVEEAYRLDLDPAERTPVDADDPAFAQLRREALRALSPLPPRALSLRFENLSGAELVTVAASPRFRRTSVKWTGRPCPGCIEYRAPGRLLLRLAPHASVSVRLTGGEEPLDLVLEGEGPVLDAKGAPVRPLCGAEQPIARSARLAVYARIEPPCPVGRAAEPDDELAKRLRALGYLQ